MNLFLTGTDTGVGKTYVTRLLLEHFRAEGIDAVAYKPVSSGEREDATILAEASGDIDIDLVNPVHLKTAVAPMVACMLENRTINPAELIAGYEKIAAAHQMVIVEGAGGWEVPLAPGYHVSDLAKDLGLPVVVVAANQLGALNHILLTTAAIQAKGLECKGVILNQLVDELDTAMITNKGVLENLTGIPLLEHLIHGQEFLDPEIFENLAGPSGIRSADG